ncbi:hypothetical protein JTB14_011713 [Gonioctena quinquepunctata]|nr:hypothetical protein JTB14_011713 [Gonioctena quinquepunctata]
MVSHIESFEQKRYQYRREHAPRRRYLPNDMEIKLIVRRFSKKISDEFSHCLYRQIASKQNKSFAKLRHEECWSCEMFTQHTRDMGHKKGTQMEDCERCNNWNLHRNKYIAAREEYQKDSNAKTAEITITANSEKVKNYITSKLDKLKVVLQLKVIMLPRCDTFKEVIFCPRLVSYNESIVPAGNKEIVPSVAVIWHDAIRGRSQEDIISVYYAYFLSVR